MLVIILVIAAFGFNPEHNRSGSKVEPDLATCQADAAQAKVWLSKQSDISLVKSACLPVYVPTTGSAA